MVKWPHAPREEEKRRGAKEGYTCGPMSITDIGGFAAGDHKQTSMSVVPSGQKKRMTKQTLSQVVCSYECQVPCIYVYLRPRNANYKWIPYFLSIIIKLIIIIQRRLKKMA